jgi:hypothetical protein
VSSARRSPVAETAAGEEQAPILRMRLSDPRLVDELLDDLLRHECAAERLAGDVVAVSFPDDVDTDAAKLELDLYLRVWDATHPGVRREQL